MRAPAGALGGRKVGRFLRKRRGHVWPARRSSPTGSAPGWGVAGAEIGAYLGDAG